MSIKSIFHFLFRNWYFSTLLLVGLACFVSVLVPPTLFWPSVYLSYAVPFVVISACTLAVVLLVMRSKLVWFPLILVAAGLPFLMITFRLDIKTEAKEGALSCLSFNAKLFRKSKTYGAFSTKTIDWAVRDSALVKCFQEYSTNNQWKGLDVTRQMENAGHESFVFRADMNGTDHNPGMAIFSKLPIIDSGYVWKKNGSPNAGMFADIVFGRDTLRVYNVHLESMHLNLYQFKRLNNYFGKLGYVLYRLKEGALKRSDQVSQILAHARESPFPFLICGDFNETPYSNNYLRLRRRFSNAFEIAGSGFGFSFNSALFFLRIDHHFVGDGLGTIRYLVDRSVETSDHFATRGFYYFDK